MHSLHAHLFWSLRCAPRQCSRIAAGRHPCPSYSRFEAHATASRCTCAAAALTTPDTARIAATCLLATAQTPRPAALAAAAAAGCSTG